MPGGDVTNRYSVGLMLLKSTPQEKYDVLSSNNYVRTSTLWTPFHSAKLRRQKGVGQNEAPAKWLKIEQVQN